MGHPKPKCFTAKVEKVLSSQTRCHSALWAHDQLFWARIEFRPDGGREAAVGLFLELVVRIANELIFIGELHRELAAELIEVSDIGRHVRVHA